MTAEQKIQPTHLSRVAFVYLRQSTAAQVLHNRESTDRQYKLVERARDLGWAPPQIQVLDQDLGQSAQNTNQRNDFARMTTAVALGQAGLILAIEVSRVARSNADWYRLLDLCGVTDTLIGDEDGLYHPGLFNDRLLLGLKGTMAEAEGHVIRARLEGGIRNKAARGELRRGLPVGFLWGEKDGEVRLHPDQAVKGALTTVFEKFAEVGSARQVWLHFRSEGLRFPLQSPGVSEIRWVIPTYVAIHHVLTNPVYAGAYVYGKTRQERYVDEAGQLRKRLRRLPRSEWQVLLEDHHEGYIDWETYERNQARLARNTRPRPRQASGGAVREGAALLQGLARCGCCGRRLRVAYRGRTAAPGYYCSSSTLVNGRGSQCLSVGGVRIDGAVGQAFVQALTPAGLEAALQAEQELDLEREATLRQWRLQAERAHYEAERAERRYRAVEPENRLVARTLEAEWERRLNECTARRGRAPTAGRPPSWQAQPGATGGDSGFGEGSETGLGSPHDHRPGSERVARQPARRGHHPGGDRGVESASDAALARRCPGRAGGGIEAAGAPHPHRRRHPGFGPASGGSLPGWRHRRGSQPPGEKDGPGTSVYGQPGRQSASALEDPSASTSGKFPGGRTGDGRQSRRDSGSGPLDRAPMAGRWVRRRRTNHARGPLANPHE